MAVLNFGGIWSGQWKPHQSHQELYGTFQAGGVVHCGYSGNPLYVEIQVWDDGAGFDTEDLPHLFDRFYRGPVCGWRWNWNWSGSCPFHFELQNGTITACNLQNGGACFEIRMYSH